MRTHTHRWSVAMRTEIHYVILETFLSVYRYAGGRYLL
jgi:hypothetical protein